jgi:HEAT repeat protein
MTNCPICQKPVDPLRAPAARIRDGKVIPYCSKECAAAAETKPVARLDMPAAAKPAEKAEPAIRQTPAKGVPASRRTPVGGIPTGTATPDSGPVIEIVHEPASGVVTSAADARSGRVTGSARSETDGAIQIAETGTADDYIGFDDEPRRGRGLLVVLLLALVLVGAGAGAYYMGYLDEMLGRRSGAAVVEKPAPTPIVVEAPADAKPPEPTISAVDRARDVLRVQLHSDSPRVQRIAASALARTGDPEAIALLATALGKETSDIAKLDFAYALARAGDKRGTEALVSALGASRRDVRAEAAGKLAVLGDPRAVPALTSFLEISQMRLGAAEQLAYLAEPHGLDALDKVRGDDKASADDKARAAIGLGLAGRKDIVPALHELLDDSRFNTFSAIALATLHDPAAHSLLVKHLEIPSLRVGAARGLRLLDPAVDQSALLPPLVAALASKKDTEQVQVAEAVLLLAGPVKWSEHE